MNGWKITTLYVDRIYGTRVSPIQGSKSLGLLAITYFCEYSIKIFAGILVIKLIISKQHSHKG